MGKDLFFSLLCALFVLTAQSVSAQEKIHVDAGDMRFTLEGYGQANYNVTDADGEKTDGFELSRFMLMTAADLTPKLKMYLMLDVASKTSDKVLHEYWGQYKVCDELSIKFGQYKTDFSMENPMSPTAVGNIYFHDGVAYMAGMAGDPVYGNYAGRDMGLTLSGSALPAADGHKYLSYSAGLFNGSGMNKSDNNTQKDLVLKLGFSPVNNFTLAASAYLGTGFAIANDPYGQFLSGQNYKRQRVSLGFEAKTAPLYLRSEYIRGWNEGTPSQTAYGEAWLHVLPKQRVDVILDYEYFDRNIHLFDATRNYMAGLQWWFHKQCRISSLFQYKDPATGGHTSRWVTQLQLRF